MLTFATLLGTADIPLPSVRLLRHQDNRYPGHPTPYVLWRDHRARFEAYQETQAPGDASALRVPCWASFVGMPGKETLFVGLYRAERVGPLPADRVHPVDGSIEKAGSCDLYNLSPLAALQEY
jgi:hypothetical protein